MPSIFNLIALITSSLVFTSASPLVSRGSCNPNFEGTGVSVVNNALEWGLPASPASGSVLVSEASTTTVAEWRFRFSGAPTNTYTIKFVSRLLLYFYTV
jgi:hypothetical protein